MQEKTINPTKVFFSDILNAKTADTEKNVNFKRDLYAEYKIHDSHTVTFGDRIEAHYT